MVSEEKHDYVRRRRKSGRYASKIETEGGHLKKKNKRGGGVPFRLHTGQAYGRPGRKRAD